MSRTLCLLVLSLAFLCQCSSPTEVPKRVAGIPLGASIDTCKALLRLDTAVPVQHNEALTEISMQPMEGYREGSVYHGNCANPGRIVRIKLKYACESREFFEKLLEGFERKFGKPDEYKGDPFRAFIAWKWSFVDEQSNRISMILQHNSDYEEDYPSGNTLKISEMSRLEEEERCYEARHPESAQDSNSRSQTKPCSMPPEGFLPE